MFKEATPQHSIVGQVFRFFLLKEGYGLPLLWRSQTPPVTLASGPENGPKLSLEL